MVAIVLELVGQYAFPPDCSRDFNNFKQSFVELWRLYGFQMPALIKRRPHPHLAGT
jgi:hypothetical protein